MNSEEAKTFIFDNIVVTKHKVVSAKALVMKRFQEDADSLITGLLQELDAQMPQQVILHSTINPMPVLKQVCESITWKLAICEAIWSLIHNNILVPAGTGLVGEIFPLSYTTVVPGSGGSTGALANFGEISLKVPDRLKRVPSEVGESIQPLSDPDLYLGEINVSGIDDLVESALREAVKCFRQELYLACLAMLGRASEGAFIELGKALVQALPKRSSLRKKYEDRFEDPFIGIGRKILDVVALYEQRDLFKTVRRKSEVRLQDLRNLVIWADSVRESRNSIHYGFEPPMSNSHEKVATLLIGAVPYFKVLYRLKNAALRTTAKRSGSD